MVIGGSQTLYLYLITFRLMVASCWCFENAHGYCANTSWKESTMGPKIFPILSHETCVLYLDIVAPRNNSWSLRFQVSLCQALTYSHHCLLESMLWILMKERRCLSSYVCSHLFFFSSLLLWSIFLFHFPLSCSYGVGIVPLPFEDPTPSVLNSIAPLSATGRLASPAHAVCLHLAS